MLPPSEARTPRLVTSATSGAVTWTTSAPARPQTASWATSVTTASPSLPGSRTGSARCTSNRSWAIDQVAWWRCTSATAIRAAVRLAAASSTAGARPACSLAYRAACSCTADRARTSRCTGWASQPASRCAPVGSTAPVCPAMVRRGPGLGGAGVRPGLLLQQPQRAAGRRLAVLVLVILGEPLEFAGDGDGAGAEQLHHVLADPADLGAVAVGPGHHGVPERGQPGFQDPVGDRGDAEPLVVQGAGVQGPPRAVGPVGALDAVPDRDVHVDRRVAAAGQMGQEQAGDQPPAVPPLPAAGGMVTGPGVGGMLVEPADGFARRVHQRVLQLIRPA